MTDLPARPDTFRSPLLQLVLARLREFLREPAAIFWVYGFPLFLAIVLGLAFQNRPVERIDIDLVASPEFPAAAKLQAAIQADPRVRLTTVGAEEARTRLRTAKTSLVITPSPSPPGFGYLLDADRPESVLAKAAAEGALLRAENPKALRPSEARMSEPGSRYIDFLLPGLMGANLMGGGLFGVGFVIVDMRVRKLLKRFLATPMRKTDFLLSLMLSRMVFTMLEIGLLLLAGRLFFDVRVQGNPLALLTIVFLGGLSFSGLGLLIASRARTLETVSGLMNAIMLPMYMLGGVFFATDRFPTEVQPILQSLPLTALNNGLRAVINEGGGWEAVRGPAVVLVAWTAGSFAAAARLFRWL